MRRQNYEPFDLRVDDDAIETIANALFRVDTNDDTIRVRFERSHRDRIHEVLNRVATLQQVKNS